MEVLFSGSGRRSESKGLRQPKHEESTPAKPIRVLVVEDDWLVAMEIESALINAGYDVVGTAVSAEESIEMAARLKPHVITMDIRLNGQRDGFDAAIELYQRFGLRCLLVSAYSNESERKRVAAAKPLGWLQKPFMPAQLVLALEDAMRILKG